MTADPATGTAGPILVGGTGRSGTTIVGELLGARDDLTLVPIELRFQCDPGGLQDLAAGIVGFADFRRKLMRRWFARPANNSGPRGVHVVATREHVLEALRGLRLELEAGGDPWSACGSFLDAVVLPWAAEHGSRDWIEMTPPNAGSFDGLARMLPSARFVHMLRDGRDVAASVVGRTWGPDDLHSALTWWGDRLAEIGESISATDPSRVLTVRLETLVGGRREAEYARLEEFVGRDHDPAMRAFFDERMSRESARPGAWARNVDSAERAAIDELYAEQTARLAPYGFPLGDAIDEDGGAA